MRMSKFSPIARAIGVIGGTAALVTGVTFANLTSNSVALTPNFVSTAGASLVIAASACESAVTTSIPGFTATDLVPGGPGATINFCLGNTGDVPLTITGSIPQDLSGSIVAQNTNLTIDCVLGTNLTANLNSWGPGSFANSIPAGGVANCTATVTLSNSYTGSGNQSVPAFTINFVGTQV